MALMPMLQPGVSQSLKNDAMTVGQCSPITNAPPAIYISHSVIHSQDEGTGQGATVVHVHVLVHVLVASVGVYGYEFGIGSGPRRHRIVECIV